MTSTIVRARQQRHRKRSMISFGVAAVLAVAATAQVTSIDDSGRYRQEVQACNTGQTQQDRENCLREARNAQAARQRGRLDHADEPYAANAIARCDVFQGDEERRACIARVRGEGTVSGSVAGGGLLREYSYEVPAPATTATGDTSAAMGSGPAASGAPVTPPAASAGGDKDAPGSSAGRPLVPAGPMLLIVPVVPR